MLYFRLAKGNEYGLVLQAPGLCLSLSLLLLLADNVWSLTEKNSGYIVVLLNNT